MSGTATRQRKPQSQVQRQGNLRGNRQGRGRAGKVSLVDTWYPVMGDDGCCVYCGCNVKYHAGKPLMFAPPGEEEQVWLGCSRAWCIQCADNKQTRQAVCYMIDSDD